MTKCMIKDCPNEAGGHKQWNLHIVVRVLLCREHMSMVFEWDSFNIEDARRFKKLMDGIA